MGKFNEDGTYTNDNGETFSAKDADYAIARENNAAQPRGMWDAGSQSWIPAQDQTHGKASRKWNPGGVSQWEQAAQQQRDANIGQLLANEQMAQGQMWNEFSAVMDAVKQKKAQNALAKQNASASLMRVAMENGGPIPDEAIALYNRMFNYDGQTAGLVGGSGFMKDGSFNMRMITGSDVNGNPVVQDVKADLPTQFVMMNRNLPVFGQNAVGALAGKLKDIGYSPREIENLAVMGGGGTLVDSYRARGGFGDGSAGGRNIGSVEMSGSVARRLFGVGGDNRSRISFFGTGGAGTGYTMRVADGHTGEDTGFVNFDQRQAMDAIAANPDHPSHFKVVSSGPRKVSDAYTDENGKRVEARHANGTLYRNDMTGEELWVPEGSSLRAALAGSDPKVLASQYGNDARMALAGLNNASREKVAGIREEGKNARAGIRFSQSESKQLIGYYENRLKEINKKLEDPLLKDEDKTNLNAEAEVIKSAMKKTLGLTEGSDEGSTSDPQTSGAVISAINGGGAKTRTSNADDAKRKELEAIRAQKAKLQASQKGSPSPSDAAAQKPAEKTEKTARTQDESGSKATKQVDKEPITKSNDKGMRIDIQDLTLDEEDGGPEKPKSSEVDRRRMNGVMGLARLEAELDDPEFVAYYNGLRKRHGYEDISKKDAFDIYERDLWRKFKKRVGKNLEEMNRRQREQDSKRRN